MECKEWGAIEFLTLYTKDTLFRGSFFPSTCGSGVVCDGLEAAFLFFTFSLFVFAFFAISNALVSLFRKNERPLKIPFRMLKRNRSLQVCSFAMDGHLGMMAVDLPGRSAEEGRINV